MTMTSKNTGRESVIVAAIVKALRRIPGCIVRKRHGTAWGVAGDPDIYGSIHGQHFEIEVKRPGGRLTPLQEARLREWWNSGAITGIAHNAAEALEIVAPISGSNTKGGNQNG